MQSRGGERWQAAGGNELPSDGEGVPL